MATTDLSTGSGRRKQAKPQRKNVEVELGDEAVVTEVGVGAASPPPGAEHLQLSMRLLSPEPHSPTTSTSLNSLTLTTTLHSPQTPNTFTSNSTTDTDNVPLGGGAKDELVGGGGGGVMVADDQQGGQPPRQPPPPAPPAPGLRPAGLHSLCRPFPTRDQLDKHELLHSPNTQVSCKVCNKTFANVYRLQRHMISHDESAVLRKFKCPECDKAFKFKHHLKEHIRIHSGEKPFECANCGKRFSHSGSYSSHMTSKKCLVMNLKVSQRQNGGPRALDPKQSQPYRTQQPVKRTNNNNNFPPILPKYTDAAATAAFLSNFPPHPFYLNPGFVANPPSHYNLPTSLNQLLEHLNPQPPPEPKLKEPEDDGPKLPGNVLVKREVDEDEKRCEGSPGVTGNNGDLETVKRILETVNANVTKEFLAANVHKMSTNSCSSGCPSVGSGAPSPPIEDPETPVCRFCNKSFASRIDLHQHERYLCADEKSEGLAAKLEDVVSVKREDTNGNVCSASEDETRGSMNAFTDEEADGDPDGRKVRVRSQIADEQLQILKSYYAMNPRPKREELARIAERVGFPVRVVQVWFQNTRARDRREGRLVHVPYAPRFPPSLYDSPAGCEQPLDLSTKKLQSCSPDSSPHRSDSEDGGSGSATSTSTSAPVNLTHHKPLLDSRLARILSQPNGVMLYPTTSPLPPLAALHNGSFSPNSDKRSWRQGMLDYGDYAEEAEAEVEAEAEAEDSAQELDDSLLLAAKRPRPAADSEPDGQFNCDQCDKTFAKHSSLARHKYEHSGQRPHKCDICPKAFKHKHHLTEHKRLHSGEKPFQCLKCLKRFSHSDRTAST